MDATSFVCSHGAARTVTGSRHQVRTPHGRFLLDCGLFQGSRDESNERNRHVGIEADAVLLSHAHIDHSGALPSLVRDGFRGPIYATPATRDLCAAMLMDVAKISVADARHVNEHQPGSRRVEPIYTPEDVEIALTRFVVHPYDRRFEVIPGVLATFQDAGHIIGSAGVLVEIGRGPSIYFTGDLGRPMYPILKDPAPLPDADVILSECTYGQRQHEDIDLAESELAREVERCVRVGGRLLIPAFSVGRTQNLVYALARLWEAGAVPRVPVFVDSPLARRATQVYSEHPECWDAETRAFSAQDSHPFWPDGVDFVADVAESQALNERKGPFVVIAGSGMCEGGRILHHLVHGLGDTNNTVLFVGWCAPRTLGRKLLDGDEQVRVFGVPIKVRARIASQGAFSAHADRNELLAFLAPARPRGSRILLVHGDVDACHSFRAALMEAGHSDVGILETYQSVPLLVR